MRAELYYKPQCREDRAKILQVGRESRKSFQPGGEAEEREEERQQLDKAGLSYSLSLRSYLEDWAVINI